MESINESIEQEVRAMEEEMIDTMQFLVDTNIAWYLGGRYAHTAEQMIHAGVLHVTLQ